MKIALLLLLVGTLAVAEEDAPAPAGPASPWQVRADLQIVRMPQARALALTPRLLEEKTAVAAYAEIQKAIEAGEMQLAADLSGESPANKPSGVIGEVEEFRYCVEYEEDVARIGPAYFAKGTAETATGYPATTFDTIDCGATFEFEGSVLGGGKVLELHCTSRWTAFEQWTRYETGVRKDGLRLYVEQPSFAARTTRGTLIFHPGIPQVLALHHVPGPTPMVELHLVTAKLRDLTGFPGRVQPEPAAPPEPRQEGEKAPEDFGGWQMRMEIQQFRVGEKDALRLRGQLLDERGIEQAGARLRELVAGGQARLVHWQNLPLKQNERGVAESCRDFRYAIERSNSWPTPQVFGGSGVSPQEGYRERAFEMGYVEGVGDPPTTFETKMLGLTTEVEATPGEGGATIGLSTALRFVELANFTRWTYTTGPDEKTSHVYQPNITCRRAETNLRVKNGASVLLSFNRVRDGFSEKGGEYEIVILRAGARDLLPK